MSAEPLAWDCRRWWPAALALASAVLVAGWYHRPVELRVRHGEATAWMAEALPGIGPRTREAMAAAIRRGDLEALPQRVWAVAQVVFVWDDGGSETGHREGAHRP